MLDKLKANADIFLTIAETGSFRKAAETLGYTQAGISYIINSIEEETGLILFVREHNGVRLSPEGELLLPGMKQLKIWEHQMIQTVNEINHIERGTVRVQIFDSISIHWIPGILKKFHDDFPGIHVELVSEEDSLRAEEMVLSGEVDCGFFLTEVQSKIDVIPLLHEKLLAIVPPDHPLSELEKFPIDRLGDFPYISMKYDDHTGIGAIFLKKNIEPRTIFRMDNDYAAMAMVSNGLGICIFPELLLKDSPYELCQLEFDEPQNRTISIGTRNLASCSRACAKFIEYTKEWVKSHK